MSSRCIKISHSKISARIAEPNHIRRWSNSCEGYFISYVIGISFEIEKYKTNIFSILSQSQCFLALYYQRYTMILLILFSLLLIIEKLYKCVYYRKMFINAANSFTIIIFSSHKEKYMKDNNFGNLGVLTLYWQNARFRYRISLPFTKSSKFR